MSRLRCSLIRASRGEKEKKISDTRRKIQFQRANLGYSQGAASLPRMYLASSISASRNSLDFRWPAGSRSHRPSIACISHVFRENMPDKRGPEREISGSGQTSKHVLFQLWRAFTSPIVRETRTTTAMSEPRPKGRVQKFRSIFIQIRRK